MAHLYNTPNHMIDADEKIALLFYNLSIQDEPTLVHGHKNSLASVSRLSSNGHFQRETVYDGFKKPGQHGENWNCPTYCLATGDSGEKYLFSNSSGIHAEMKLLEKLRNTQAKKWDIYLNRLPCDNCSHALNDFAEDNPNITLNIHGASLYNAPRDSCVNDPHHGNKQCANRSKQTQGQGLVELSGMDNVNVDIFRRRDWIRVPEILNSLSNVHGPDVKHSDYWYYRKTPNSNYPLKRTRFEEDVLMRRDLQLLSQLLNTTMHPLSSQPAGSAVGVPILGSRLGFPQLERFMSSASPTNPFIPYYPLPSFPLPSLPSAHLLAQPEYSFSGPLPPLRISFIHYG